MTTHKRSRLWAQLKSGILAIALWAMKHPEFILKLWEMLFGSDSLPFYFSFNPYSPRLPRSLHQWTMKISIN